MRALFLAAAVLSLAPVAQAGPAGPDHQAQVLVVYSTRRDAQVALVGERDLPRRLESGLGGRLDYYAEFIDPARFSDPEYQSALGHFLRKKYEDHRFDVIVAINDDALSFVGAHRDVFAGMPPIVFYGSSRTGPRPADSTGVIAELNLRGTVELAAALDPALRHVFLISGADNGRRNLERIARAQLQPLATQLDFVYLTGLPTKVLEERLATLPPHSAVYYLVVDQDGTGQYFHPLEYIDRVIAASNAPVYSWVDSTMGRGVVGGSLKNQAAQVAAVAEVALRVLRGEPADTIPVAIRDLNEPQVDWRQVQRWGFSASRIPAGTAVLFRDPTPWERYGSYIIAALIVLLAQTALIAGLLMQRTRRRLAEDSLVESQNELRASYHRIHDLGARLLKAQESERSHIARELHDDVGQQLALIEMDLKLLSNGEHADAALSAEILDRVQSVGRSLRELSHRLHPAKLRLIGLVAALKGLQAEMSHSGIEVTFTHENVPSSLPPELTLCLFRVTQEALKNTIKYSQAAHASVSLRGRPNGLDLTVRDDGTGFNVSTVWGRGLGLASMLERVESAGGDMLILSELGHGTSLEVSVPIEMPDEGSIAV